MRLPTCQFGLTILLATSLSAASGVACAFDDPIDLGRVSAGPRPDHRGVDLPVGADTLLATTAGGLSPGLMVDHADMPPVAARSNTASLAAAVSGIPARVTIAPMSGNAATGLQATVSITLTATSMTNAAGQAAALPTMPGIVSVGYSFR